MTLLFWEKIFGASPQGQGRRSPPPPYLPVVDFVTISLPNKHFQGFTVIQCILGLSKYLLQLAQFWIPCHSFKKNRENEGITLTSG
jgi:hypothetical protein